MTGQLHHLTAVQQLEALRSGEVGAVELTQHYLRRIEQHDSSLGAYLTVSADVALAEAEQAQRRLRTDEDPPPLLGLPVPIKDLSPTAGVRTTMGSRAFADFVPAADSWTVGRIRTAGAVLIGKTNVPEFGPTCYTDNDLGPGPARTPYDLTRYASGSSGGAAAAVAAGLAPVAHGSDGAGSVRTPASACGLVGFKPSRGTVSLFPQTTFTSMAVEGPLARTLEDAALLGDVMTVPPPGELWPDPRPPGSPSLRTAVTRADPGRLRVAWWTGTGVAGLEPHPAVADAVRLQADRLEAAGHDVSSIDTPTVFDERVIGALVMRFAMGIGAANLLVPEARRELLRPLSQWFIDIAARSSAVDAAQCDAVLAGFGASALAALADFDVLLCPTASGPPVPLGWFSEAGLDEEPRRMIGWSCGTPLANVTGYGAISLPLAWTEEGLPLGVQLAMPPGRDHELFAVAAQLFDDAAPRPVPPMF